MEPLLSIRNLSVSFHTEAGDARAVDGVSFDVFPGETLGVVGESGCGKTVTALSLLRLIQAPGHIDGGEIFYYGRDLLTLPDREIRAVRGNEISMIFQEPMTSLNPVFTCGYQIREAILLHQDVSKSQAREQTIEMLDVVGIPDPRTIDKSYPHQLSGGMRQRVMIAMALSCNPSLLIADEPTTALDVTIQAQILELLQSLQEKFKMAIMLITHDLGVIAETAKRVVVMYAGQVVEAASVADIFGHPQHPYTMGLQASIPRIINKGKKLSVIPGRVPDPLDYGHGCRFADRCSYVEDRCNAEPVALRMAAGNHEVRCWKEIEAVNRTS
jgi:oligopeptide/dipeptide ABC transporter ATP-binding protein